MSPRTFVVPAFVLLFATACQSTPQAPSPETQAIVESIAKENPDITRLTVHRMPAGGSGFVAVASTLPAKLGKPSDPEDLDAMQTGKTIVIDEAGGLDVTVPICKMDGKFCAAAGVTFKTTLGSERATLVARGEAIAKTIEARLEGMK